MCMMDGVDEIQSEADCDLNYRCDRLEQRALTALALLMQEACQSKAHGRFALELDYQAGVIQRMRRTVCVTEM